MVKSGLTIENISDSDVISRARIQDERHRRNSSWLQRHWSDMLPQARGKFVAVAGEEAYIAASPAEAWDWVKREHPEDNGAIVRYVRTELGPRLYANRG